MHALANTALLERLVSVSDEKVDPDADVVARFCAGERGAFDLLVRRHQQGVWRLARRYTKHDADAADVTQLVFVKAFNALVGFRGAATVRSWLYRITINAALTWVRDHKRELASEIPEDALVEAAAAETAIAAGQEAGRLRAAIAQLPPKQKLVLELRVFDDLAFKEVAELADCSENTAKVNFHYAVKRLRELLGDREGSDV
ncbi:MAG TPA: RNA polymerase sigma factor [Kofleriaceae bacterium]|jgi:RNA polymerase sigma-70 factor (ECF subfamily)